MQKHFKGLLSRLISKQVALPGCMWVTGGGLCPRSLCMSIIRPSLGNWSFRFSGRLWKVW